MIPFGSQLIGQTEKALNALLATVLSDDRLTEPEWVVLRLTAQFDGVGSLSAFIRGTTHFSESEAVLSELTRRGLVSGDQLTEVGRVLVERLGQRITIISGPIWDALDADDIGPTERALNTVLERTRRILSQPPENSA
jgi:hypothetical protein